MSLAPLALFVYNRPKHAQQAVDALRNNHLAGESELFIFSDGPKDKGAVEAVLKVRDYIKTINGFRKVTLIERENNLGLSQSIITGVSELIVRFGKVIVLEDDIVTSPYFLQFMNDALLFYQDEGRVISVCAYMYPLSRKYADTLFLRVADCWGWATWKRGWDLFSPDVRGSYNDLRSKGLFRKFNLDGAFNYVRMLKKQMSGKDHSWAILWYASAFLNEKLSLYPGQSLVVNTGFDGSGRHGGVVDYFKTEPLHGPVTINRIPVLEDEHVIREIEFYLKRQRFNIGYKALEFIRKKWQSIKII